MKKKIGIKEAYDCLCSLTINVSGQCKNYNLSDVITNLFISGQVSDHIAYIIQVLTSKIFQPKKCYRRVKENNCFNRYPKREYLTE